MKQLNLYIIEKLKIDKDIKVSDEKDDIIDSLVDKIYYEPFKRFENDHGGYHIDSETEDKLKRAIYYWLTDKRYTGKKTPNRVWMYSYYYSGRICESNKKMTDYYIQKLESQSSVILFSYDEDKEKRFTIKCAEKIRGNFEPVMLITTTYDKFIVINND